MKKFIETTSSLKNTHNAEVMAIFKTGNGEWGNGNGGMGMGECEWEWEWGMGMGTGNGERGIFKMENL